MKKLFLILLAMIMCVSLVACGGGVDKQPAIDAFNNATNIYDKLVNEMNANIDAYPPELIDVMKEMSDALLENKAILESNTELTEENVSQMVAAFAEVQKWAEETYADLDAIVAETNEGKQAIIDVFNETSTAFDALGAKINANPDAYDEQTIDVMKQMADALIQCKDALESDVQIDAEIGEQLINDLENIKAWIAEADAVLLPDDAAPAVSAGGADKQVAIEMFNSASNIFNAISAEVNSHIDDFSDEFVDGMIMVAEGLQQYQQLLQSGAEISQAEIDQIVEDCQAVIDWALEHETDVFG